MITLRQVEAFKAVMEAGTMLRAAEQMGLSQPAISRLIGDLEKRIGYQLFERRKGRIVPRNQAGALYAEVERAFVGLGSIADAAQRIGRGGNCRLRIAVLLALDLTPLATAIAELAAEHPDVEISLDGRSRARMIEDIAEGRCDLAFSTGPVERPDVGVQTIARTESCCVVPANHALAAREFITPEDLHHVELIVPSNPGPAWRSVFQALRKAGVSDSHRMSSTSAEYAYALVAAGLGITFAPRVGAARLQPGTRIVPFRPRLPFHITAQFSSTRPPEGLSSRLIQSYAEALRDG